MQQNSISDNIVSLIRTCLFTPHGGTAQDIQLTNWSATVNGTPFTLVKGDHRCGSYNFTEGWVFDGFDSKKRNETIITGEFTAPCDGVIEAGLSGDWFYDIEVDGKNVFSTGSAGNNTCEYGFWNNTVKFDVTAGHHTITVKLVNGLGEMMFAIGKPASKPERKLNPVTVEEAVNAARRVWSGDVYDRTNPERLENIAVLQRAVDMTSGKDAVEFAENGINEALFQKAPALAVINAGIDRAIKEIPEEKVAPGSIAVWYLYDMGHIVKTPGGTVFAIDLSCPRDDELADLCDFALVTHNHADHASERVLRAMQKKGGFSGGKPLVSAFMYSRHVARYPKVFRFGDCTVETGVSDHNEFWPESMTPFKITCGTGPDAVTLLHAGDGWNATQLMHFAPVDIAIVHVWPFKGHNAEKTAQVLKPNLLVISHAQELTHGFGPGRWSWIECESEAVRAKDADKVIYPVWGEKFVWHKTDACLTPEVNEVKFELTAPAFDTEVPIFTDLQKDFILRSREERRALFADEDYRKKLADGGWRPKPLTLQWTWKAPENSFKPLFKVEVFRQKDILPVVLQNTATTSVTIDNLEIATTYMWKVSAIVPEQPILSRTGTFKTEDFAPRILRIDGIFNSRDLGGRIGLGGKRVKQGMIFRTGGLNDNSFPVYYTKEELIAADTKGLRQAESEVLERRLRKWRDLADGITPVNLVKIAVTGEWTYFNVDLDTFKEQGREALASVNEIPQKFLNAEALTMTTNANGTHAFPFDSKGYQVMFKEIYAEEDGEALIGASADWFWTLSVNGEIVADFEQGNTGNPEDAYANPVPIFVKKGRNILAATLRHGMAGCVWTCRELEVTDRQEFLTLALKRGQEVIDRLWVVCKGYARGKDFITDTGRHQMLDEFGIRTELDLRTEMEVIGIDESPLGDRCKLYKISSNAYSGMRKTSAKESFAQAFRLFLDPANYGFVFHCAAGQDRTGAVAFILLGLLGVEEDELYKDWEATGFWNPIVAFRHENSFDLLVDHFNTLEGNTLNDRIVTYVKSCGFTDSDIERFRAIMLE